MDASNIGGRRDALKCMLWAGAGVLWTVAGGVPRGALLGSAQAAEAGHALRFVQRSVCTVRPGLCPIGTKIACG